MLFFRNKGDQFHSSHYFYPKHILNEASVVPYGPSRAQGAARVFIRAEGRTVPDGQRAERAQPPPRAYLVWQEVLPSGTRTPSICYALKSTKSAPFQDLIWGISFIPVALSLCQAPSLHTLLQIAITACFHAIKHASNSPKSAPLLPSLLQALGKHVLGHKQNHHKSWFTT